MDNWGLVCDGKPTGSARTLRQTVLPGWDHYLFENMAYLLTNPVNTAHVLYSMMGSRPFPFKGPLRKFSTS